MCPRNAPRSAQPIRATIGACLFLVHTQCGAAEWTPSLSVSGSAVLSDNARLQPAGQKETDLLLSITPSIGVRKDGARLKVDARYSPFLVTYVGGAREDYLRNQFAGTASLEAIENFFFIDARGSVTQSFLSPFGQQPSDLGTTTANRVETTYWGVSPYVRGRLRGGSQYTIRDDILYSTYGAGGRPDVLSHAASVKWDSSPDRFLVPGVEYNFASTQFGSQPAFTSETSRLRLAANVDPAIQVFVSGGYERNDFVFNQQQGAIYGGGLTWKPSPRTSLRASIENRFFGNSYDLDATYRTALTAWTLRGGRRIQTSQQLGQQIAGTAARSALDSLLTSTIPDPVERQLAIDRLLAQSGLGTLLAGPVPIYSPRILLVESIEPTVAIQGSRTTLAVSAFWRDTSTLSEAVVTSAIDAFAGFQNIVQRGGFINLSHRLDPALTGTLSVGRTLSTGKSLTSGQTALESKQSVLLANVNRQLDPQTFITLGFRWQIFSSNLVSDVRERAVLFSVVHTFF